MRGGLAVAALGQNEFVVHGYERMLDLLAAKPRQPSDGGQNRAGAA